MWKYRIGIYILLCFTAVFVEPATRKNPTRSTKKPQTTGSTSTKDPTTVMTTTETPKTEECIATKYTGALTDNTFWNCSVIKGNESEVEILITHWKPDYLVYLANNLTHIENIEIKLAGRDLSGFSFRNLSSFKNLSLVFYNNTNLNFDIFPVLNKSENLRLKIRGNMKIINSTSLTNFCNETANIFCDIQLQDECVFAEPISKRAQYENCRAVYGDMEFRTGYDEYLPRDMKFELFGCFKVIGSFLRILAHLSEVKTNCSTKHEIKNNNLLCKEDRQMTIQSFGAGNVDFEMGNSEAECAKAECFGYGILEAETKYFLGCETVKSQLQIDLKSGDLKDRIRDFGFIRTIEGEFVVENNPSIEKLALPLLKNIHARKCPALTIQNMPNLTSIIFHPYFTVTCEATSEKKHAIVIKNCPKLILRNEAWRWDKQERFDYDDIVNEPRGPFFYIQFGIYTAIGILILIEIFVFTLNRGQERSEELEELLEFTKE